MKPAEVYHEMKWLVNFGIDMAVACSQRQRCYRHVEKLYKSIIYNDALAE